MTNILLLPQLSGSFEIVTNSDWLDSIFFSSPGTSTVQITGALVSGSDSVVVSGTGTLTTGQPIVERLGIPPGTYVGSITSSAFTLVDINNNLVDATYTEAQAVLTLAPLPLDLTGITFTAQFRQEVGGTEVFMTIGTADTTIVNGGKSGLMGFNVLAGQIATDLNPAKYVMDIIAQGDGHTINIFSQEPATIIVNQGVTIPL